MILVRYSEIGLKGPRARSDMERMLMANIAIALKTAGINFDFHRDRGRIFISTEDDNRSVPEVTKVFGVKSVSVVKDVAFASLADLSEIAELEFRDKVRGKTFAVRSRRTGSHKFTSLDMDKEIGRRLLPYSRGVSLVSPEETAFIEVRDNRAYLYSSVIYGPGGLPIGSEGKMTALVSGGIDSPIACWRMMKRGCKVDIVFVSLADPLDTGAFLRQIKRLLSRFGHGYDSNIYLVNGSSLVSILTSGQFKYPGVSYKRILYLLAQEIGTREGSLGIVTGESLGQVSSQTPENLLSLSFGLRLPVHRPLIGMDKDEIIEESRKLDLMPDGNLGEFCSLFSANPALRVTVDQLQSEPIDPSIVSDLISAMTSIRASEIGRYLSDHASSDISAHGDASDSVVIDLRRKEKYDQWHYPGSISAGLTDLGRLSDTLDREKKVILYCSKGLQSAHAASILRKKGFNALYTDEETIRRSM
ncbi:MAG: THUMP domain-containing protein [Candidatus Thermoplasmatota archaeon]|nr:THUMP domain-containing protein [Candidatus Thermoplasmatota archaeon]